VVRIGLHALGIGAGARPDVVAAVARASEQRGVSTLWCGEHVVMIEGPDSRYPYASDGRIAVPRDADWSDPLVLLAYAAAVTTHIRLATGVLLLAEHHPLIVAKQAASVDVLSQGRLMLGIGIGWSAKEFEALGIPFARRAARTRDYVQALRCLWRDDVSSYQGEFTSFDAVRSFPKPVRRSVPVFIGGNSDAALERVVAYGDGWYGFDLTRSELADRLALLDDRCRAQGRDRRTLEVAVAIRAQDPEAAGDLELLGVHELVLVGAPPPDPADASAWVTELTEPWLRSG
jgi:probable F420-dependent oxidoreductase